MLPVFHSQVIIAKYKLHLTQYEMTCKTVEFWTYENQFKIYALIINVNI